MELNQTADWNGSEQIYFYSKNIFLHKKNFSVTNRYFRNVRLTASAEKNMSKQPSTKTLITNFLLKLMKRMLNELLYFTLLNVLSKRISSWEKYSHPQLTLNLGFLVGKHWHFPLVQLGISKKTKFYNIVVYTFKYSST